MIDQNQVIQMLQRQLNNARKEIKRLTEENEGLRLEMQLLEAVNLTIDRKGF